MSKGSKTESEAWAEYLEACDAAGDRYDMVEVWAWDRLLARLHELTLVAPKN